MRGRAAAVAITFLLAVLFAGCGNEGGETPSAGGDSTQAPEPEPEETTEEEETPACLTQKKGPKVTLSAGKGEPSDLDNFKFFPGTLKLPAGKFVTVVVKNPTLLTHTFTVDALGCDTGSITADQTVAVSFKVPTGKTPFVCLPHDATMNGEIIGVSK